MSLCALQPELGLALAGQISRWDRWGSGDVVVLGRPARPEAAAWSTGSLLPLGLAPRPGTGHEGAGRGGARALAEHAGARLTRNGSVAGPRSDVAAVWEHLEGAGLRAREARWVQPVLRAPDPPGGMLPAALGRRGLEWVARGLRRAVPALTHLVLPASVDMFTAELGYDPTSAGGSYARHVSWLVETGRTYVLLDDGRGGPARAGAPARVVFKADVGALWRPVPGRGWGAAQLTGVWTHADLRGQGIATVALAAVVDAVRRDHVGRGGSVSLYVNDFNTAALGLYRGLGFHRVGTYATILL
ncbi:Predicted acetyltransferase [Actinomyces howellii]|uniref:Predicted acetyltransferase n=2 Tax=Actinomyces howellii TaxID=52771 RepID=A0A448HF66_9ACTO|nr:GNAT family N-acetyltransferase [Actinomyces howellii]VEG26898.1 Predicted acetyltransferase [Actinomyces howellii]